MTFSPGGGTPILKQYGYVHQVEVLIMTFSPGGGTPILKQYGYVPR